MHFSSIQVGKLCMLNMAEHSTSGTCRKMSLVPNGGSGRSRMSGSTNILYYAVCSSLEQVTSVQAKESWKGRERDCINLGLGIGKESTVAQDQAKKLCKTVSSVLNVCSRRRGGFPLGLMCKTRRPNGIAGAGTMWGRQGKLRLPKSIRCAASNRECTDYACPSG